MNVANGYTSTIEGDITKGYTIKNSYIPPQIPPEKTEVGVEKIWKDENNADGKRPEEITVHLYKNGKLFQTRKISGKDGWKVVFKDLDKYEDSKEILYTIKEEKVEGYTGEVSGNVKEGFKLTNTRKPETPPKTPPATPPETPPEKPKKPQNPSTGDNISLIHYEMLVLSIIGLAYIFRKRKINGD